MNEFEKVEKLREKANVTYEEAREALKEADGDLLDAMVILEKQGKVKSPEQSTYSTEGTSSAQFADVPAIVRENENAAKDDGFFKKVGRGIKKAWKYASENYVQVERKDEVIFKIPLWIALIALLCMWELLIVVIIISLFCECRYSMVGKGQHDEVNKVMHQAADFTEQVKDEFDKL